jgi:hypothetical protein
MTRRFLPVTVVCLLAAHALGSDTTDSSSFAEDTRSRLLDLVTTVDRACKIITEPRSLPAAAETEELGRLGVAFTEQQKQLKSVMARLKEVKAPEREELMKLYTDGNSKMYVSIQRAYVKIASDQQRLQSLKTVFPISVYDEFGRVAAQNTIRHIDACLRAYKVLHGNYPSTLAALTVKDGDGFAMLQGSDLNDPWGRPYQYSTSGRKNGGRPDVWSCGPLHKSSGDGHIGNWTMP